MCGIVGVCGKLLTKEENVFKTLLCLDTIRGPDSTGVLGVSGNSSFEIFKKVGTPWQLFGEKGLEKIFKYTNVLLLGHNRAATVGHVTDQNAHPFDVGDIIGVHNGTLRNLHKLEDKEFFDVDSEVMLHNFAKNGVSKTVGIMDGAFAVVHYDKRDHTVHFLRNNERPLAYAYSKDMKTLFWASEQWMLSIACARCGVEIGDIQALPEMEEHFFKLPTLGTPSKIDELPAMMKVKLEKITRAYSGAYAPWGYSSNSGNEKKEESKQGKIHLVSNQNPYSQERYKRMCKYVGQDITFSVSGFVDGKHQKFIRAYVENKDADVVEVRIFMEPKNKKFESLISDKNTYWRGHVKKLNSSGPSNGYLLLDNRTIMLADNRVIPFSKDRTFNMFKGRIVTPQEWLDATTCGCDNCGEIPQLKDAPDLEWYDHDRFFCKSCFGTQNVQNYLSLVPEE